MTKKQAIKELKSEINRRKRIFPQMIAKGKMTRKQSARKMEAMVFILNILEEEKQG